MTFAAVLAGWTNAANAQVSTVFGDGYCIDTGGTGTIDLSNLEVIPDVGSVPTVFGTGNLANIRYSYVRETVSNGQTNSVTVNGTPTDQNRDYLPLQPFDNLSLDANSATGAMSIGSGQNVTFDIDGRCVVGATRTDTDNGVDPATSGTHTTVDDFIGAINVSSRDIGAFSFQGDLVLDFTADVGGDVSFDSSGTQNDITMQIGAGSEIYGDLTFTDGGSNVSAQDIVLNTSGAMHNIVLDGSSNAVVSNSGNVGSTIAGSGISAVGVSNGLVINNLAGTINNVDASDTAQLSLTNANGAVIGGLRLNSNASPSTNDVSTTISNAGQIDVLVADRVGQFSLTNTATGRIESPLDNALVLSNSASIDFNNLGTISAASSDTIDLTNYTGAMTFTNSGSISASTSNVIIGDGSSGSYIFNNNGSITNNNSRGVTLQNVSGAIIFNNASAATGTVSTNQLALDFSDAGGDDAMNVTVTNGTQGTISATFATAIEAENVAFFTLTNEGSIVSGSSDTVKATGAGQVTLTNSGGSGSIVAGAATAFDASGASGNVVVTNSGSITADNQTIDLQNLQQSLTLTNSGTIQATHGVGSANAGAGDNYTIDASRASGSPLGGDVSFTNAAGGTISTNSDRAVGLRGFNIAGDVVTVTNAGTISAGRDLALDLEDSDAVTLSNSGTISAGQDYAVDLVNAVSATVSNSGTIGATRDFALNLTAASGVSVSNLAGGTISAGRNHAIVLDSVTGTSMVIDNAGLISAGTQSVGTNPAAIFGTLGASVTALSITNQASGTISSVGSTADTGGAVFLGANSASVNLTNAGTIRAGVSAASGVTATQASNAVRIEGIASNAVTISNSGTIEATEDRAIYLAGGGSNISSLSLTNSTGGVIRAQDFVVQLANATGATASITNAGTISATASDAVHLINLDNFSSSVTVTNSGTMSTAGNRAIGGTLSTGGTDSFTITNSGTLSAAAQTIFLTNIDTAPLVVTNSDIFTL